MRDSSSKSLISPSLKSSTNSVLEGPKQMLSWVLRPLLEALMATLWHQFCLKSTSVLGGKGLSEVLRSVLRRCCCLDEPSGYYRLHRALATLWRSSALTTTSSSIRRRIGRRRRQNGAGSSSRLAQAELPTGRAARASALSSWVNRVSDQAAAALQSTHGDTGSKQPTLHTGNILLGCRSKKSFNKILRFISQNSLIMILSPKPT